MKVKKKHYLPNNFKLFFVGLWKGFLRRIWMGIWSSHSAWMGRLTNINKIQPFGSITQRMNRIHWKTLRDERIQTTSSDTDRVGTLASDSSQLWAWHPHKQLDMKVWKYKHCVLNFAQRKLFRPAWSTSGDILCARYHLWAICAVWSLHLWSSGGDH